MAVKWVEEKRTALKNALIGGFFKDVAIKNGGTGELREPLTQKQYESRKQRNKQAKMSRKRNRG